MTAPKRRGRPLKLVRPFDTPEQIKNEKSRLVRHLKLPRMRQTAADSIYPQELIAPFLKECYQVRRIYYEGWSVQNRLKGEQIRRAKAEAGGALK